jgi:hypothetical protein
MAAVRVLRLLEYVYDDFERMQTDMENWSVPAWGTFKPGKHSGMTIYCAMLPPTTELIKEHEASAD